MMEGVKGCMIHSNVRNVLLYSDKISFITKISFPRWSSSRLDWNSRINDSILHTKCTRPSWHRSNFYYSCSQLHRCLMQLPLTTWAGGSLALISSLVLLLNLICMMHDAFFATCKVYIKATSLDHSFLPSIKGIQKFPSKLGTIPTLCIRRVHSELSGEWTMSKRW